MRSWVCVMLRRRVEVLKAMSSLRVAVRAAKIYAY